MGKGQEIRVDVLWFLFHFVQIHTEWEGLRRRNGRREDSIVGTLFVESIRNLIPDMSGTSRYCEKANDSEHPFDSRELTIYLRKSHETLLQTIRLNTLFRIQTLRNPNQQLQATTSKTYFFYTPFLLATPFPSRHLQLSSSPPHIPPFQHHSQTT